jgi:hypothetical protein
MAVKKTTKTSTVKTTVKTKNVASRKSKPTEDQIRLKAEEIYWDRIARGADGTPEDDWHLAEKLLKAEK